MPRAVVLLSGGMDSATTLALAVRDGYECHALTVRYGQRHEEEICRAEDLARSLRAASHRVVAADLSFASVSALTNPALPVPARELAELRSGEIPVTYVPARNTVLLALGLSLAESVGAFDLFLGANAIDYSGYPDCRPEFLQAFEALAKLGTRAGVEGAAYRVQAPLLRMTKGEIVRAALALGVDLARTISCYDPAPGGRACGRCDACRLRAKGFAEAGLADPAL
jgi:7-cyano-7-deazaguanine synthase